MGGTGLWGFFVRCILKWAPLSKRPDAEGGRDKKNETGRVEKDHRMTGATIILKRRILAGFCGI